MPFTAQSKQVVLNMWVATPFTDVIYWIPCISDICIVLYCTYEEAAKIILWLGQHNMKNCIKVWQH